VTPGAAAERPPTYSARGRLLLLVGAAIVLIACVVPPLSVVARRYEFAEALQFSLLAIVVPVFVVSGSPWCHLGLAGRSPPKEEKVASTTALQAADALAQSRKRHPEVLRSAAFAVLFAVGVIIWRIPPMVNALASHPWLLAVEAITLLVVGIGLWLELIDSPPLKPRLSRPNRIGLAALSMWTIWVLAYLVGLSHASWYHGYAHVAGGGFSLSADQQLTTGVMWFISGCAFIPVIFWNLVRWLQSEESPDEELRHLVRMERIRNWPLDRG
jgi:cytochrome c oxidase assembly factor CtaG